MSYFHYKRVITKSCIFGVWVGFFWRGGGVIYIYIYIIFLFYFIFPYIPGKFCVHINFVLFFKNVCACFIL